MNTTVYDLRNQKFKAEYSLPPEQAVICAYAQFEKGDNSTWTYQDKYSHLLRDANRFVSCGDYTAYKEFFPNVS